MTNLIRDVFCFRAPVRPLRPRRAGILKKYPAGEYFLVRLGFAALPLKGLASVSTFIYGAIHLKLGAFFLVFF